MNRDQDPLTSIRTFYDRIYYARARPPSAPARHLRRLARRIGIRPGQRVLDVACGTGEWLLACRERGAEVAGVDLSARAITICRKILPQGEFHPTPAETLPFENDRFDVVTCLGSLEHFVAPLQALREMLRVAKPDAAFLILVPNADFLTRRLGLFSGTCQTDAKEDVRTLAAWEELFGEAGLEVMARWPDLHVLSWAWITLAGWRAAPLRAAQALALAGWPLRWQYQVYHRLRARDRRPVPAKVA